MKFALAALVLCLSAAVVRGQGSSESSMAQLNQPRLSEDQQRNLFNAGEGSPFLLAINAVGAPALVENAAARQLKGDKLAFPFLNTLPGSGSAVYITTLKPCGIILPHIHPRATEQYLVVSGAMVAGLAEEASGRQNVTANVYPGQSFVVPQGLLHYNSNRNCTPLVFLQIFNNADPGVINVLNAISALGRVDQQSIAAANASSIATSSLGAFALDQTCLSACGLSSSGGDLSGLSQELQAFIGVAPSPASGPAVSGR